MRKKVDGNRLFKYICFGLAFITLAALILFFVFWPDNLMHSDTAAEVIFADYLSNHGGWISKEWFYSTEIRIIYTHLIMKPLFTIFSSYHVVKLISIVIFDLLIVTAFCILADELALKDAYKWLALALLLAPLSNEYLDMMCIGSFYACQTILTYLVLKLCFQLLEKKSWLIAVSLAVLSFILGLSGLRYLASLYLPLVVAFFVALCLERDDTTVDVSNVNQRQTTARGFVYSILLTFFAGAGFLVNKFYFATHYSFDTTSEVTFVSLEEAMERFVASIRLMLEFFGYRRVQVVTPLGAVNVIKFIFFLFVIYVVVYLTKNRNRILSQKQKYLLYFFYGCFLINWYMLIFTTVLLQYRYWLPIYIILVYLIGIYLQQMLEKSSVWYWLMIGIAFLTVLTSLYGELWQDTKYNDCAKRYGYMEFLEENAYTFGYATFWNSSVTEYLADGTIKVGHLGGQDGIAAPYEWLSPKAYYEKGFHTGKTFLLLAKTEEAGMLNGDFTVMPDGIKVYEDEYYVIYEGKDMYLFLEEVE